MLPCLSRLQLNTRVETIEAGGPTRNQPARASSANGPYERPRPSPGPPAPQSDLPILDLVACPDEEVNEEKVIDGMQFITKQPHHIDGLYKARSSVRLKKGKRLCEPGLYTSKLIERGKLIGLYTGYMIELKDWKKLSTETRKALGRYTVSLEGESKVRVSPISPSTPLRGVDFTRHPLALTNEPQEGMDANAFCMSERVETQQETDPPDSKYGLVQVFCMYACKDIEPFSEILWVYGKDYKRKGWKPGNPCSLENRELKARGSKGSSQQQVLDMVLECKGQPSFEYVARPLED